MSDYNNYGYQRRRVLPPAIKTIVAINVVLFFLTYMTRSFHFGEVSIASFLYENLTLYPIGDYFGLPSFKIWQLITYQFMHANIGHIFFNLFSLWMFGSEVEEAWGAKKFTIFYLLSGVGAGLAQLFVSPLFGAIGPTVGASGAVYGIMLAFAMLNPDRSIMIFPIFIPIKAKYMIIGLIAFDLIVGLTDPSNVAHFAHLGGAAMGFLLFKFGDRLGVYRIFGIKKRPNHNYFYEDNAQKPIYTMNWDAPKSKEETMPKEPNRFYVNDEEITQNKIDEILDKINNSGYQNLSEKEKKILFELSKKIK
jgi:membrane associated rhomboid family serine protease